LELKNENENKNVEKEYFEIKSNELNNQIENMNKKLLNDSTVTKIDNKIIEDNENLMLISKIEKLESEKMILNNDILELKNENDCLHLKNYYSL
jgi:hypothetical protein